MRITPLSLRGRRIRHRPRKIIEGLRKSDPEGDLHLSLVARAPHGCRSAYCRTLDLHCARRSFTIQPARVGSSPLVGSSSAVPFLVRMRFSAGTGQVTETSRWEHPN